MARLPRLYVEGCPQHVVQQENNRPVCFYCDANYAFYLQTLLEASQKYQVDVHAFVLMTNHVHLLVTPAGANGGAVIENLIALKTIKNSDSLIV